MKKEVYVAVLDMQTVTMLTTFDRKYEGIAKFPSVTRDLALVVWREERKPGTGGEPLP